MADNSADELLDDAGNNPLKIPAADIAGKEADAINNPTVNTENMEVHKHPQHVTHKKKLGEYLLEFFMLFLAVFLGFIAENIRESLVEKERAHQFLQSMLVDVSTNIKNLDSLMQQDKIIIANHDSLVN